MSYVQDLADKLAADVLAAEPELEDDRFYEKVSQVLLAASPTFQEAYITCIRVRLAERRGRIFLEKALRDKRGITEELMPDESLVEEEEDYPADDDFDDEPYDDAPYDDGPYDDDIPEPQPTPRVEEPRPAKLSPGLQLERALAALKKEKSGSTS